MSGKGAGFNDRAEKFHTLIFYLLLHRMIPVVIERGRVDAGLEFRC